MELHGKQDVKYRVQACCMACAQSMIERDGLLHCKELYSWDDLVKEYYICTKYTEPKGD